MRCPIAALTEIAANESVEAALLGTSPGGATAVLKRSIDFWDAQRRFQIKVWKRYFKKAKEDKKEMAAQLKQFEAALDHSQKTAERFCAERVESLAVALKTHPFEFDFERTPKTQGSRESCGNITSFAGKGTNSRNCGQRNAPRRKRQRGNWLNSAEYSSVGRTAVPPKHNSKQNQNQNQNRKDV